MFRPVVESDEVFDLLFKLVLIGDAGVGKTCLVQRFMGGSFIERHSSTIGVDFTMKTITIDGKKVKLQIWDTAGQERFRTITQSYYRSANGVILAFDTTRYETFLNCARLVHVSYLCLYFISLFMWFEDVKKYATPNALVILVGNKNDLTELRNVPENEARQFCEQNQMTGYVETSAKDNTHTQEAFMEIAKFDKKLIVPRLKEISLNWCYIEFHNCPK
ncbi:hypothetical protein HELRODRAFT_191216 [Helobdella robusta]|uniref:Ras-related protein Rab-43 n=1 Tax=Helobdella robusta TaxID=6412 RepID=T1FSR1_HELRO|nr:hypothetical protein HELRODRAFT_191216 [Helobdella robusta]ESO06867.1 hypothetical protein HELRODRAFT_191216 [Helobdella robusta]